MSEGQADDNSRNGRRSASAAFADDGDQSMESPLRKKQNTATSVPGKVAPQKDKTAAKTPIDNSIQTSTKNGHSRDLGVGLVNGASSVGHDRFPPSSIQEKEENVIDIAPPTSTESTTPHVDTASKNSVQAEATIPTPQDATHDNISETKPGNDSSAAYGSGGISDPQDRSVRSWSVALGWFGFCIFVNLFLLSGVVWTGLLLNERVTYQLESLDCRERLQQTYQAMGLDVDLEDMGEDDEDSDISDRFEEQRYYWQELEAQVRYWKKEAKKYQRYGDAYKDQCQTDLRHLLSEVDPN